MKTMRPHLLLLFSLLLIALATPEAIAQDEDELPKEAPDEVLQGYLAAVRNSPTFQAASTLRPEVLEPHIPEWEERFGVTLEFHIENFLDGIEGRDFRTGRTAWELDFDWVDTGNDIGRPIVLLHVHREGADEPDLWQVSVGRLQELDFGFAESVIAVHPLNRLLGRHTAREMQLTAVLSTLAELAGCDHAINHSEAGEIRVTFDFRDRRISECLNLAARVAGWRVMYMGNPYDDDDEGELPANEDVGMWDVAELWSSREHHNARHPDARIETPTDALAILLAEAARHTRAQRVVVTMVPDHDMDDDDDDEPR